MTLSQNKSILKYTIVYVIKTKYNDINTQLLKCINICVPKLFKYVISRPQHIKCVTNMLIVLTTRERVIGLGKNTSYCQYQLQWSGAQRGFLVLDRGTVRYQCSIINTISCHDPALFPVVPGRGTIRY